MQLDKRTLILFPFLSLPIWPRDLACHCFLLQPVEVQEVRKNTYDQQPYTSQPFIYESGCCCFWYILKVLQIFLGQQQFLLTSLYNFATHLHSLRTSVLRTNPHPTHFCNNAASACYMYRVLTGVKGGWFDGDWCNKAEGSAQQRMCVFTSF